MLLPLNVRVIWEQEAAGWLYDPTVCAVVSVYGDEVVGGLFARRGVDGSGTESPHKAAVLALVIDLHTIHQRQGVGRVLWQALRAQLHQDSITRVYAAQTTDMLENTFWPSLGAKPLGQWFELDI
jgi:GNAT superfamily N-acetyltransferase